MGSTGIPNPFRRPKCHRPHRPGHYPHHLTRCGRAGTAAL